MFFLGNMCMPPESKITVKEIQRKFGEVAVDVQKCKKARRSGISGRF